MPSTDRNHSNNNRRRDNDDDDDDDGGGKRGVSETHRSSSRVEKETNKFLLREWSSCTTQALLFPRATQNPLSTESTMSVHAIMDHAFGENLNRRLKSEIQRKLEIHDKLTPARTMTEVWTDELSKGLNSLRRLADDDNSNDDGDDDDNNVDAKNDVSQTHTTENTDGLFAAIRTSFLQPETYPIGNIRGDLSTFVPRGFRSAPAFAPRYPFLHHFISSIEQSALYHLSSSSYSDDNDDEEKCCWIELDTTLTSVQIAVYPGDGQSGYVRHCDRGLECRLEEHVRDNIGYHHNGKTGNVSAKNREKEEARRIITAVYYLTDEDWDEKTDGGCLRVYYSSLSESTKNNGDRNDDQKTRGEDSSRMNKDDSYYDIIPYPDRLVLFRSDVVEHEVLPSKRRERMAITVWLYGWIRNNRDEERDTHDHTQPLPPVSGQRLSTTSTPAFVGRKAVSSDVVDDTTDSNEMEKLVNDISSALASQKPTRNPNGPPPLPIDESQQRQVLPSVSSGENQHESPPVSTTSTSPRIFVSIPSYRDPETHPTILSLLHNATYPSRVYVGLVRQIDTHSHSDDDGCFQPPLPTSWSRTNLRTLTVDYRHARGPCWARHLAQTLHHPEEERYILQIDSHMRFRRNWDAYLIQQLHKCPDPNRAVLTAYPVGYALPDRIPDETRGTVLVPWKFDADGMLRQRGRLLRHDRPLGNGMTGSGSIPRGAGENFIGTTTAAAAADNNNDNIPCHLFAAGFNFSTSSVVAECPYDAHLPHLFFGEEPSMAIRLYTRGYDLFAPPQSVCYHLWNRNYRRTFQSDRRCCDVGWNTDTGNDNNNLDNTNDEPCGGDDSDRGADHAKIIVNNNNNKKRIREANRIKSMNIVKEQLLGTTGRGLGSVRTAQEFASALGVNFAEQTISKGAENGCLRPDMFATSTWGVGNDLEKDCDDDADGGRTDNAVKKLLVAFLGNL